MPVRRPLALAAAALVAVTTACSSAPADESETQGSAVVAHELDAAHVNAVIAKLDRVRNGALVGRYYEDGARLEGCWRNPAGSKLTELKKAFYCSMPLEFRLCNTLVLLTIDESRVADRYQGYLDCQLKVDAVFGRKGLFVYEADVNELYETLYLKGATLSGADTAGLVAARKPTFTDRSFPVVLLAIGRTLAEEAVDLAADGLASLADDVKARSGDDPR
jgi:hypothetical protein